MIPGLPEHEHSAVDMIAVRVATYHDIPAIASLRQIAFPDGTRALQDAERWVRSKFHGSPVSQYYVAVVGAQVTGYILWAQMGGFRPNAVLALEELAVSPAHQRRGCGTLLVDRSLDLVVRGLQAEGRSLKLVYVTTAASNQARTLYISALGAAVCSVFVDFFDGDELVLLARTDAIQQSRQRRGVPELIGR